MTATRLDAQDRVDGERAVHAASTPREPWLTQRRAIVAVRASVGLIFLWFGFLKFFPGLSPAEALASNTLRVLSCGILCPKTAVFLLALFESALGLLWLSGRWTRGAVLLLWLHMSGTALPVLLFPAETFTRFPYAPTFEGQYILKNIVIVCASLVVWTAGRRPAAARR